MASLTFKGYYRESQDIPATQGIYLAYAFTWTNKEKGFADFRLLYIGRAISSDTLRNRVQDHIDGSDPKQNHKNWGHKLTAEKYNYDGFAYSYAELEEDDDIPTIETALIYANKDNGIYNDKDTKSERNEAAQKLKVVVNGKCIHLLGHTSE